jgi:hypothetical protein
VGSAVRAVAARERKTEPPTLLQPETPRRHGKEPPPPSGNSGDWVASVSGSHQVADLASEMDNNQQEQYCVAESLLLLQNVGESGCTEVPAAR